MNIYLVRASDKVTEENEMKIKKVGINQRGAICDYLDRRICLLYCDCASS